MIKIIRTISIILLITTGLLVALSADDIAYAVENKRYKVIAENITTADINMLARLVWLEARGESDAGQRAVIEVVFNRVMSKRFPNTIKEVIYAKNQFTPAKKIAKTVATSKEYRNVYHVLYSSKRVLPNNVVYFSTTAQNNKVYAKIGGHIFCLI
ncbi:MAG: cell wall hydrolase [Bacillota bacterium]